LPSLTLMLLFKISNSCCALCRYLVAKSSDIPPIASLTFTCCAPINCKYIY
jgi:hypothetical protein